MKSRLLRIAAIAIILSLFLATTSTFTVFAEKSQYAPSYSIYNAFMRDSYPEICTGKRMYLMTLESCENQDWLFFINQGWLLDLASWALDKDLDTDQCIEILSNIVTMANYQLEDAIIMHASENTKQQVIEFALDTVGVLTDLVGMDEEFTAASNAFIRSIPTVTGISADTLDLTVDSIAELELLNQLLGDYTMQFDFLNAVATYSDLESMREAAQILLETNEQIFLYKLDTFSNVADLTATFLAKDIFIDKVAVEMLNDPTNFSSESTMFASAFLVGAHEMYALASFAFDFTILIGDGLFGTKNTYQQYNEMKAMRDIRAALIESIDNNIVTNESDRQGMEKNISLLKIIQYVDAWGETCAYTSAKNEGTFIGDIWPRDTSIMETNFQTSLDYFSSRVEVLNSIYIDITPVIDTAPPEPITEEDRVEDLYEFVAKRTSRYCKWLTHGDYDNDGTDEIYAYVCPDENDRSEGEIWYLTDQEERRIFWLTDGECSFFLGVFDVFPDSIAVNIIKITEWVDSLLSNI